MEFSGCKVLKLDVKGRVFLPGRFVEYEDDKDPGVTKKIAWFWLTLGLDGCLMLFDQNEWRRTQRRLKTSEFGDRRLRAVQRLFFEYVEKLRPDSQARILIPDRHRERAGIEAQVLVLGVGRHIELWSPSVYEEFRRGADPEFMTDLEAVFSGEGGVP